MIYDTPHRDATWHRLLFRRRRRCRPLERCRSRIRRWRRRWWSRSCTGRKDKRRSWRWGRMSTRTNPSRSRLKACSPAVSVFHSSVSATGTETNANVTSRSASPCFFEEDENLEQELTECTSDTGRELVQWVQQGQGRVLQETRGICVYIHEMCIEWRWLNDTHMMWKHSASLRDGIWDTDLRFLYVLVGKFVFFSDWIPSVVYRS